MKLLLVSFGKPAKWLRKPLAHYLKRIRPFAGCEHLVLKKETFRGDEDAVREAEADRLRKRLSPRDRLVVLDERGERQPSEGLARWVGAGRNRGVYRMVFVIGGAYGLPASLRSEAWKSLRLSDMVLAHDVALLVLGEQLYRATQILQGTPYHH